MKLAELRTECEKRGLPKTGSKKELEARLNTITHVPVESVETIELHAEPSVKFTLGDCLQTLQSVKDESIRMIYMDPPFDSDRNYTLSVDSTIGFSDVWDKDVYQKFITKIVDLCYTKLAKNGTLFFHISADKMFVPETILRAKFKIVLPIFWKKCRSKNNVKSKLGATIDILFKCTKQADAVFNLVHQPKDAKYLEGSFKNKDERGNYALGHLTVEPTKKGHEYSFTIEGRTFNPPSGWRIKLEDLEALRKDNRLHVPKGEKAKLYKKIYLH
jgi:site-specific DNA-methyltransferase (adenine-specific)